MRQKAIGALEQKDDLTGCCGEQTARDKSGSSSKESTKIIQILMVSDGPVMVGALEEE